MFKPLLIKFEELIINPDKLNDVGHMNTVIRLFDEFINMNSCLCGTDKSHFLYGKKGSFNVIVRYLTDVGCNGSGVLSKYIHNVDNDELEGEQRNLLINMFIDILKHVYKTDWYLNNDGFNFSKWDKILVDRNNSFLLSSREIKGLSNWIELHGLNVKHIEDYCTKYICN